VFVAGSILRRGSKAYEQFRRFVRSNTFGASKLLEGRTAANPSIELFICVIQKDFWILKSCIELAIKNSLNPIEKVSLVTQSLSVSDLRSLTEGFSFPVPIEVISEDDQLDTAFRNKLAGKMGSAYGWALQQFLTVDFVLKSKSQGVLAINADTLIVSPRLWFDGERQTLFVSHEFHRPYYSLLNRMGMPVNNPRYTFIAHQMLFRPVILAEILNGLGTPTISHLLDSVLSNLDTDVRSPMCIEFELYAQGICMLNSNSYELQRFGNFPISIKKSRGIDEIMNKIQSGLFNGYNSISLHSWS
jgi:hypothetical protein